MVQVMHHHAALSKVKPELEAVGIRVKLAASFKAEAESGMKAPKPKRQSGISLQVKWLVVITTGRGRRQMDHLHRQPSSPTFLIPPVVW